MQDVVYVAIVLVFTLLALFVPACERIIGSDEEALALGEDADEGADAVEAVAA